MSRWLRCLVLVALCFAVPSIAAACPVCYAGAGENRVAYLVTTVFMSLLPLFLVGGLIFWVRRTLRDHAALLEEAAGVTAELSIND